MKSINWALLADLSHSHSLQIIYTNPTQVIKMTILECKHFHGRAKGIVNQKFQNDPQHFYPRSICLKDFTQPQSHSN